MEMTAEEKAQMKVKGNVCEVLGRAVKGGGVCYEAGPWMLQPVFARTE
jgi:hypothetical protein